MTATETLERPKDKLKKKSIKKIVDQDDSPDLPKPKKVKTKKSVKKQTPTFNLKGLSKAEFEERLQKFGQNAIPEVNDFFFVLFLGMTRNQSLLIRDEMLRIKFL